GESRAIGGHDVARLLPAGVEPHQVCCFVRLSGRGVSRRVAAENFATLVPWKWVTLGDPSLKARLRSGRDGLELSVTAKRVAPFVHAAIADTEGHFAGDWQVMQPGREYILPWVPHRDRGQRAVDLASARRKLAVMSLFDLVM
nr:hypothetical protein [Planctomycetota bacterium]